MEGILLIDKPPGITSYGVVDRLKKRFALHKVGHGGTLDPMATGLLIVLLGRATKIASKMLNGDKEYEAVLLLGQETDTQDIQGRVLRVVDHIELPRETIEKTLDDFRGEIEQIPPMVSALKYRGRRLYQLARRGVEVPRRPRKVMIKYLELLEVTNPYLRFRLRCSKGTYIRTLGHDLGKKLGCGACLASLRRTAAGPFKVEDASSLSDLLMLSKRDAEKRVIPLSRLSCYF